MPDTAAQPAADVPADLLRRYAGNVAWLYRQHPDIAQQLEALPFSAVPPLEPTRDGNYTVRLTADDGRSIYAHSRYRPLDEATKLVDALPHTDAAAFFFAGCGLGHHVMECYRRAERPLLIIAEDDLALLKAALCVTDFTPALRESRVILFTTPDKTRFHRRLEGVSGELLLGLQLVSPPGGERYHREFRVEMQRLLAEFMSYGKMQIVTLLRNNRTTSENIALNTPYYLANPGVETLKDRARGYPAIVVAAGPSLTRNIDQLPALRERAVIIAVQTVYKLLLSRGLSPHFVTSLDFHAVSAQFFRDISDHGDTALVAEPKANWNVLDAFTGRKHVLHNSLYDELLRDATPRRGSLRAGSTVAHLCLYLAEHLGCDPIIFVGQDLSFSEALYYAPGMPIERTWQPELHRFYTVEMKQWERIVRSRAIVKRTTDLHGRPAYTDDQMLTYAEQFQADFAQTAHRIIQASEGGRLLSGMTAMPLREAAEMFCTQPLPGDLFAPAEPPATPPAFERARAALHKRLDEVREMKRIANETHGLLKQLITLIERPAEFNRLVARVDALRSAMSRHEQTYQVVVRVSQMAELRRFTADRRIGEGRSETTESARARLQRDQDYVAAFIEGCEFLEQLLPRAIERMPEAAP